MNDASELDMVATDKSVGLEVLGIVRQRILFKTRPRALITSKFIYTFMVVDILSKLSILFMYVGRI